MLPPEYDTSTLHVTFDLLLAIGGGDNRKILPNAISGFFRGSYYERERKICLFCVEVLRPSQPNGVMSSAVSLPNHTFTGQA